MLTPERKISIVLTGAAAIGTATGLVLWTKATDKEHEAFRLCADPKIPCAQAWPANALMESNHNLIIDANIAFGASAIAIVAASVLWISGGRDAGDRHDLSIAMYPSSTGSSAVIAGRF